MDTIDKKTLNTFEPTTSLNFMKYGLKHDEGILAGFQHELGNFNQYALMFKWDYDEDDASKKITLASKDYHNMLNYVRSYDLKQKYFYELLRDRMEIREFYDVDFKKSPTETRSNDEITEDIVETLIDARNQVYEDTLSNRNFVVLTANSDSKISIHLISLTTKFESIGAQKIGALRVVGCLYSINSYWNIDTSVYSKNRAFRCLGNTKRGEDRPLKVYKPEMYNFCSFEDSLICIYPERQSNEKFVKFSDGDWCDESEVILNELKYLSDSITPNDEPDIHRFIEKHPEYMIVPYGERLRLNRKKNHRTKCLTCDEMHSTENGFIYSFMGVLYFRCFCNNTPLRIGVSRTATFELPEGADMMEEHIDVRLRNKAPLDEYAELIREKKFIIDVRNMGSGKSYSAINYAKMLVRKYPTLLDMMKLGMKIALIHNRMSLDEFYCMAYGATSYRSKQFKNSELESIVINSIGTKLSNPDEYACIIIDEIGSVIKQLEMTSVSKLSLLTFVNILSNYKGQVIGMDANLDAQRLEWMKKIRPDPFVIGNIDSNPIHKIKIHQTTASSIWNSKYFDKLLTNDYSKQKIIVATNLSVEKRSKAMIQLIKCWQPAIKICEINKYTRETININDYAFLLEQDIIWYSPTISEGVSFDGDEWKNHIMIGFFTNESSGADTCTQMIRRFRTVKEFYCVLGTKAYSPRYDSEEKYYEYASYHQLTLNSYLNMTLVKESNQYQIKITKDIFWDIHCINQIEKELGKAFFRDKFCQLLHHNLFQIEFDIVDEMESQYIDQEAWNLMSECQQFIQISKIENAKSITTEEARELEESQKLSLEKTHMIEKYRIRNLVNCLDDDDNKVNIAYRFFSDKANRKHLKNLKHLIQFECDENFNVYQIPTKKGLEMLLKSKAQTALEVCNQETSFAGQKSNLFVPEVMTAHIFNNVLVPLGFNNVPCWTPPSFEEFDSRYDRLQTYLSFEQYRTLCICLDKPYSRKTYRLIKDSKPKFGIFIDNVLKNVGICIDYADEYSNGNVNIKCIAPITFNIDNTPKFSKASFGTHQWKFEDIVLNVDDYNKEGGFFWSETEVNRGYRHEKKEQRHKLETDEPVGSEKYMSLLGLYITEQKSETLKQEEESKQKQSSKSFKCSKCPKAYTTKHVRDKHEEKCGKPKEKKTYTCQDCNQEFRDKTDYNRHNKRHHK